LDGIRNWKIYEKKIKEKIINIFGVKISNKDIFNIIILDYIIKIAQGKNRFCLKIILNLLRKKYNGINEN
jgi:hypothetical protein